MNNTEKTSSIYGTGTVGNKGQVVIPAKLRKELSLKAGDELIFIGSSLNGIFNVLKIDTLKNLKNGLEELIKGGK